MITVINICGVQYCLLFAALAPLEQLVGLVDDSSSLVVTALKTPTKVESQPMLESSGPKSDFRTIYDPKPEQNPELGDCGVNAPKVNQDERKRARPARTTGRNEGDKVGV